jgi:serine/threonine protein kinase/WD40 repeat protein
MLRCLSPEQLDDLLDGQMEAPDQEVWAVHLDECPRCRQMFDDRTATPDAEQWRLAALEMPELAADELNLLESLKQVPAPAPQANGRGGKAVDYSRFFRGDSLKGNGADASDGQVMRTAPTKSRLPEVPGFEILGELGRGGMGVVYRARQTAYDRPVALKMILAGHQASTEDLGRFNDEAEAISRLRHPHIVQIFEVGQIDGRLFFVLEYVEGGTLADKIKGKPLPARSSAQLVESLSRAMYYAHLRGIVHRDLKPANVLLHGRKAFLDIPEDADRLPEDWDFRRYMPKITDFGLAKLLDRNTGNGHTASGDVVGTPSYMAPEQAQGKPYPIGPTTDVYSLGAILYEMITGRPPFQGATPMDTLFQVHTQEPVPPRKIVRDIPANLQTICLKCLRKEPAERYHSAEELAEDLRLFLEGLPIQTRGLHPVWRSIREFQESVGQWFMAGLVFVLSLIAGGLLIAMWMRNPHSPDVATPTPDAAVVRENASLRLRLAQTACERGEIAHGLAEMSALLEQVEHNPELQPFQSVISNNVAAWARQTPVLIFVAPEATQAAVLLSRAGGFEVDAIGMDRRLIRRQVPSGGKLAELPKGDRCQFISGTADGGWLAAWAGSGPRWWDLVTNRLEATREFDDVANCKGIDLSPDGTSLLLRAEGRGTMLLLLVREPGKNEITADPYPEKADTAATAWHPRGSLVLIGREDGTLSAAAIKPWEVRRKTTLPAGITAVTWIGADIAAVGCADGHIRFWNATGSAVPEPSPIRAHAPGAVVVASGANGMLLSGGNDRSAKLWNIETGDLLAVMPHPAAVQEVAFVKDGKAFLTRDALGTVRVWTVPQGIDTASFAYQGTAARRPEVSTNAEALVVVLNNGRVVNWQGTGSEWSRSVKVPATNATFDLAMPSPDGLTYLTAGTDNGKHAVQFWGLDQQPHKQPLLHDSQVTIAAFRADGKALLTGTVKGSAQLWELAGGVRRDPALSHPGAIRCAAFRPDGQAVILGGAGEARVWSLEKANEPLSPPLRHAETVVEVGWEAEGRVVRTLDIRHVARRWDFATGQRLDPPSPIPADAQVVAHSPNGDQCLTLGPDGALRLLLQGGKIDPLTPSFPAEWKCASFSADGRWLLTGWSDGVRLWDGTTGRAVGPLLRSPSLSGAAFVQNQSSIVTWSTTEAKLWTLPMPVSKQADELRTWLQGRTGLDLAPDGSLRFLDGAQWGKSRSR